MKYQLAIIRFFKRVNVLGPTECWLWTGACTKDGHGKCRFMGPDARAHVVAFEFFHGPLEEGVVVRHKCDVPACCNPFHLVSGTHADNVADRVSRDRSAKGSKNGRAKLDEEKARAIFLDKRKSYLVAEEYGIHPSAVRLIRTRRSWSHATEGLTKSNIVL